MSDYACPGIGMRQPPDAPFEGYVACYRAGHVCPPKVAIYSENDTYRYVKWRCPCCGDPGISIAAPKTWNVI